MFDLGNMFDIKKYKPWYHFFWMAPLMLLIMLVALVIPAVIIEFPVWVYKKTVGLFKRK